MKKVISLFLLFAVPVNAQNDEIYEKIAAETCSCMDSKKLDFNVDSQDNKLMMTIGFCMVESYSNHKMELSESDRAKFDNNGGMKTLGEKVGIKMIAHCPEYMIALGKLYTDVNSSAAAKEIKIEGKVSSIETKQFVTIKLKDKNGRIYNFLLLNYFDTASLYTEGKIKAGTELTIGYAEVEMYDPEAKDFKYFKIITSLQKK